MRTILYYSTPARRRAAEQALLRDGIGCQLVDHDPAALITDELPTPFHLRRALAADAI